MRVTRPPYHRLTYMSLFPETHHNMARFSTTIFFALFFYCTMVPDAGTPQSPTMSHTKTDPILGIPSIDHHTTLPLPAQNDPALLDRPEQPTVELYDNTLGQADSHPILLLIPEKYRYGSSKTITKSWGINILTYYPSFSAPSEPENKSFGLNCAGFCNGRILISLQNRFSALNGTRLSTADFLVTMMTQAYHDNQPSNVDIFDNIQTLGFDHVFTRVVHPKDINGLIPDASTHVDKYLYHKVSPDTGYDLFIHCSMSTPVHVCDIHFSSSCINILSIEVSGIPFEQVKDAFDIYKKVDQFISSLLPKSHCTNNQGVPPDLPGWQ